MTVVLAPPVDQDAAVHALYRYVGEVADALGVGLEGCTVDQDAPVSAYLALDTRLPTHPHRDLALLWHEEHGWSAAIETHSGEDLLVVDHLGGPDLLPPPHRVARFVQALCAAGPRHAEPPRLRTRGALAELAPLLHQYADHGRSTARGDRDVRPAQGPGTRSISSAPTVTTASPQLGTRLPMPTAVVSAPP